MNLYKESGQEKSWPLLKFAKFCPDWAWGDRSDGSIPDPHLSPRHIGGNGKPVFCEEIRDSETFAIRAW
ncbi:MAG: hypothetical protein NTW50_04930 [Candidatus Berkelbacteria bacterium]|nr:hypothetical protein [Candidatus Berkelbacteria bacterium]